MSATHIASAAFVKVSIGSPSGNRVAILLRRGDVIPEGVPDEQISRLLEFGLIVVEPTAEEIDELLAGELAEQAAIEQAAFDAKVTEAARDLLASQEAELEQRIEVETVRRVDERLAEAERLRAAAAEAADKATQTSSENQTPTTTARGAKKPQA